jgi:hypothetical protein
MLQTLKREKRFRVMKFVLKEKGKGRISSVTPSPLALTARTVCARGHVPFRLY